MQYLVNLNLEQYEAEDGSTLYSPPGCLWLVDSVDGDVVTLKNPTLNSLKQSSVAEVEAEFRPATEEEVARLEETPE